MKLHYFDIPGKGEAIRLLLTHANVPFEDVHIQIVDWAEKRKDFETQQLPMLEMEGKKLYQSYAILEYLGVQYGYMPTAPDKAYKVIAIMNSFEDLNQKLFNAFSPYSPLTEEVMKELRNDIPKLDMKLIFGFIETMLAKNESNYFLVGDSYTIADFYALGFYQYLLLNEEAFKMYENYKDAPNLKAYFERRLLDFAPYYSRFKEKPKLYYFDGPGRGEMIRLLLRKANVNFEDVKITYGEWPKIKPKFHLKQIPVWEEDGVQMPQADAIMHYLSIQHGYLPLEPEDLFRALFITNTIKDLYGEYVKFFYGGYPEEKKGQMEAKYFKDTIPLQFAILEKRLKENTSQEFFVGTKYTIADFYVLGIARWLIVNPQTAAKYEKALEAAPTLKNYINTRLQDFN